MAILTRLISGITPEIQVFRRRLHMHPEPAFEEYTTAADLLEKLSTIPGIQIQSGLAGTGIAATIGAEKKGPCVALRADMDCLRMQESNTFAHASKCKGLMHACGHDGHTACLLGTALVLGEMQDQLQGPVKCIFQPAEENLGGAKQMVDGGVLDHPKVEGIYCLHGTTALDIGHIGLRSGAAMAASRYFTITVHGKGCHAASPHRGIDPVLIGSQIVCAAQSIISRNIDPFDACLISIPRFTGSTAPNVIPEQVVLEGTLRALSNGTRELLETRLKELVIETAGAHGGSAEISYYGGYPLLENDPASVRYIRDMAGKHLAEEQIHRDFPASLGAEDFAFYLEKVPGAFFWLGLQPKGQKVPSLHHPGFDFNDKVIPLAIRLLCEIAINFESDTT